MATSEDLINFDVIESQKENIQALPSGRSARTLAKLFSPTSGAPLDKLSTPTPSDTQKLNDTIRREFEEEIFNIAESDDPLDVYDRYIKWTLDAYPSAQATPQSQLLPLLERATKSFLSSAQYKNDPRYLKLWLTYIRFFSDSPRETYAFLARHGVGDGLALFYEEFAAWLEAAGRWVQAEEVYQLGIEREARPAPRLMRKFTEFQQRLAQRPDDANEPSSPAIPTLRPALAAKMDPFSAPTRSDPQAPQQQQAQPKPAKKNKLAIFNDAEEPAPAMAPSDGAKGWQSIGSLADRKKENMMEPKPWAGETLKAGGKKSTTKLAIFKDESQLQSHSQSIPASLNPQVIVPSKEQVSVNQRNGRRERVFVCLEAVYHSPHVSGSELSFEELMGLHRGWLGKTWKPEAQKKKQSQKPHHDSTADITVSGGFEQTKQINDRTETMQFDENGMAKERRGRGKKLKTMELNETQIIKTKLSSPSGSKVKRKTTSSEPTMTIHTRAATDEIYSIFSQPLKSHTEEEEPEEEEEEEDDDEDDSSDDDDETDVDYTSGAESTTTTSRLLATSEVDEDEAGDDETSDVKSVSEWSDYTARKHLPNVNDDETQTTELSHHEDEDEDEDEQSLPAHPEEPTNGEELVTPVSPEPPANARTSFIPIPPEDYEAPTRPYRDSFQAAQNRLPFMTPIAERTESSIGVSTSRGGEDYFSSKTPSKQNGEKRIVEDEDEDEDKNMLTSSPFQELIKEAAPSDKIPQPQLGKPSKAKASAVAPTPVTQAPAPLAKEIAKGPIIKEAQCNPVADYTRAAIFEALQPPLTSYDGYHEHTGESFGRVAEIRKHVKAVSKSGKTGDIGTGPMLKFPDTDREYTVKRELGAGAFAPVYLIENATSDANDEHEDGEGQAVMGKGAFDSLQRRRLEALKMEDPPSAWEFYIMRQAKRRLGVSRASESIINAYEMHLYGDEGYLIEEYREQGTLLDLVNVARAESAGVMDETLVMFFTIELFRTIEALHAKGILHGDLKADNCLVRFDSVPASSSAHEGDHWSSRYQRDGSQGWSHKGISLIDFGRGIDMHSFRPDVQFIADWKPSPQDCPELRECRPWTYQIDYFGLAGIFHVLLFGKYIETVAVPAAPAVGEHGQPLGLGTRRHSWKLREPLKRYWQTEIWSEVFALLLNPSEVGEPMPVLKSMKSVRERMEAWLEANCEKGTGLMAGIRRLEGIVSKRK